MRFATAGAAAATVTALTVGLVTPAQANAPVNPLIKGQRSDHVQLTAIDDLLPIAVTYLRANLANLGVGAPVPGGETTASPGLPSMPLAPGAPDPALIPDLTAGLGPQAYNAFQDAAASLETYILENVNLAGVLAAFGLDPTEAINNALGAVITSALAGIPIDVSSIPVIGTVLQPVLTAAGVVNLNALLDLLGFDLSDPLNLSGAATPGLNIITTGGPFDFLKFLGVDLGWTPEFPNSVADEINGTPYLNIGVPGILSGLNSAIPTSIFNPGRIAYNLLVTTLTIAGLQNADVADVRIPIVAGFGLGAFAAGMAYPQVVADLPNQPGGANGEATSLTNSALGSFTILPMILLRNPGRANGGLFARFYPLAALFGIDTVTPDTEVSSSKNDDNLLDIDLLGLNIGGANLIPIKVDATVEYDPLSDFPAWPNPFALANSAAALFFPTYILRGLNLTDALNELVADQALPQITEALAAASGGDPLALNLYLTLPTDSLPLLEPIRLPVDVINLFSPVQFNNPVATALEPFLKILVNLGYTDVDQANGYERTLDQADVITPFGTLPANVDWGQVPGDLFDALVSGIQQAADDGLINNTGVVTNPLAIAAGLLGLTNPNGTLNIGAIVSLVEDLVGGVVGGLSSADATSLSNATNALRLQKSDDTEIAALNVVDDITDKQDNVVEQATATTTTTAGAEAQESLVDNNIEEPDGVTAIREAAAKARTDLDDSVDKAVSQVRTAAKDAHDQVEKAVKDTSKRLNDIAKGGQKQVKKAVDDARDEVKKAVDNLKPKTTAKKEREASEKSES